MFSFIKIKNMFNFVKVWISVFVAIIISILIYVWVILFWFHYELWNWTHRGVITAIDTSWIIFKTTKVYFKSSKESTQEDIYCIDTKKSEDLKPYLESWKQITVTYESYISNWIAVCDAWLEDVIVSFKE